MYTTANVISSPVPKLETHYCQTEGSGEMLGANYLLKTPLLVITSALRNEAALLDPRHAAITGARDGRGTLS